MSLDWRSGGLDEFTEDVNLFIRAKTGDTLPEISAVEFFGVSTTAVNKDSDFRWNLISVAFDTLDTRWNVSSVVFDTVDLRQQLLASVIDTVRLDFNLAALAFDEVDLRSALVGRVVDTVDCQWNLRSLVVDAIDLRYNTLNAIVDTLDARYAVSQLATDTLQGMWNVRVLASDSIDTRWSAAQLVSDSFDARWDVLQLAQAAGNHVDLRWAMAGRVAELIDARWQLRQLTQKTIEARYSLTQLAAALVDSQWQLRQISSDSIDLRTGLRNLSTSSSDFRYSLDARVQQLLELSLGPIAQPVTDTLSLLWALGFDDVVTQLLARFERAKLKARSKNFDDQLKAKRRGTAQLTGKRTMSTQNQDFSMYENQSRTIEFTVYAESGAVLALTTETFEWKVTFNGVAVLSKVPTIVDAPAGKVRVRVEVADAVQAATYRHQLVMTSGSNVETVATGYMTVLEG